MKNRPSTTHNHKAGAKCLVCFRASRPRSVSTPAATASAFGNGAHLRLVEAPDVASKVPPTVHLRARRADGSVTARCVAHLDDDSALDMRVNADRERVTCALCKTMEVT